MQPISESWGMQSLSHTREKCDHFFVIVAFAWFAVEQSDLANAWISQTEEKILFDPKS